MIDIASLPKGSIVTLTGNLAFVRRPGNPTVDMKINFDLPYGGESIQVFGVDEVGPFTEDQARALGMQDPRNAQWLQEREIADV